LLHFVSFLSGLVLQVSLLKNWQSVEIGDSIIVSYLLKNRLIKYNMKS